MLHRLIFAFGIIMFFSAFKQPGPVSLGIKVLPPFYAVEQAWVEKTIDEMDLEEKIGQLLMVAAYSNKDEDHAAYIEKLITDHKIGGLMFLQGGPVRQAKLTNRFQEASKTPLLIAIDAEWGLSMRLDSTQAFPWALTLGGMQKDSLTYAMGLEIGRQLRRIGVHFNFAPVADVNNNPMNPIINARSFGENTYRVTSHSIAYMKGLQEAGVLACAKHFPGHGDTDSDSHKTLPIIKHSRKRLDSLEIYPFARLIEEGLASVMTAHLSIPSLDDTENRASTLSPKVVQVLLKEELRFKGLAVTDALNMKGVSDYFAPGEVDLKALMAGNDILLFAEDVPAALRMIKGAVKSGMISEEEIESRCRKILMAKKWLGLDTLRTVPIQGLKKDIHTMEGRRIRRAQFEEAITLTKDPQGLIPFKKLDSLRPAYIELGSDNGKVFAQTLNKYMPVKVISEKYLKSPASLQAALAPYNTIILGFHTQNGNPWKSYTLSELDRQVLQTLNIIDKPWVFVQFANPYAAHEQASISKASAHVLAYQNDTLMQSVAAQALFGAIPIKGRAPVSAEGSFSEGDGLDREALGRLTYGSLEDFGIDPSGLRGIDSLVLDAIDAEATPGAQVLVAHKGRVVFHKAYGYHTYNAQKRVEEGDIYDLASITKVAATLPAVMDLVGKGLFSLDDPMVKINPKLAGSNKANLKLREVLAHTSGLPSWIPFYVKVMEKGKLRDTLFSTLTDFEFPHEVAGGMFMHRAYADSMMREIYSIPLNRKEYKYSDLGYYLIKEGLSFLLKPKFSSYLETNFYNKLGAYSMGYLPRKRFFLDRIVPTEYDTYFRNQLIHGYVHDPGAAMMGGVGGHAGLFSSANDLAKLFQMYLQEGTYGGEEFLKPEVVKAFTQYQYPRTNNRRGAGFDKPVRKGSGGPASELASKSSFGHSGFTGTLAWVDPEYDLVYIFLSNRVYPRGDNYKLISMDVRTNIQEVIYRTIQADSKAKP